jgi:hypothetical protein
MSMEKEYRRKAKRARTGKVWVACRQASTLVNQMNKNRIAFDPVEDREFLSWANKAVNVRQQIYDRLNLLFDLEEASRRLQPGSKEFKDNEAAREELSVEINGRILRINQLYEDFMEQV